MPADYPDYPSHKQLLTYFQNYAHHFGVDKHIRFNTSVVSAHPINNNRWHIRLADNSTEEFDYLLVASGHHWNPRMPHYPGNFEGQLLHSHEFKTTEPFKDQRVLVIGGGNSACDCAVETSRVRSRRRGWTWPDPSTVRDASGDFACARMPSARHTGSGSRRARAWADVRPGLRRRALSR